MRKGRIRRAPFVSFVNHFLYRLQQEVTASMVALGKNLMAYHSTWSSFLDSIRVHRYLSTVFETVALLANMILFYLIQANPSFSIRQFKSVFMLTCVGDTLLSVLVLFGQPVSTPHGRIINN